MPDFLAMGSKLGGGRFDLYSLQVAFLWLLRAARVSLLGVSYESGSFAVGAMIPDYAHSGLLSQDAPH